ncbi:helix-turn-helix domain-containing protein, partial [Achromobacter xylosoxidans]|nr:helix-turn-helix domain-containing protein [Achromobacter xylosoxidans]
QEELGYLTGLSRQRVNQALQTLADQGVLALSYNQIKVLALDRLRQYGLDQL